MTLARMHDDTFQVNVMLMGESHQVLPEVTLNGLFGAIWVDKGHVNPSNTQCS